MRWDSFVPGATIGAQLGDHGIVMDRDLPAFIHAAVIADAIAARRA